MRVTGAQNFIERTHREGGAYQWVRESFTNALEAGATRVEYGIEWQAVENKGVYRRLIADNGHGMTQDELVEFFNTFGGGGKPIGGLHENFGVGVKTSLLPWNRYGVVVVSWVDGEASMIWICTNEDGEYGLKALEVIDEETEISSLEVVYPPFHDEDHGCDWERVKPAWIEDHGTVIVLFGNDAETNTVSGDPARSESEIKGVSAYLNRRLWEVPDGATVKVDELNSKDPARWPRSFEERKDYATVPGGGTNLREIRGAKYFITYPERDVPGGGKLSASATAELNDGTTVAWFLWDGERPNVDSYAAMWGFIGILYRNELYDIATHQATYRSFGITESRVRQRVWLIVTPPLAGENGRHGVYPRTDRNGLLMRGGPTAGDPLPLLDWGVEFAEQLPPEIEAALQAQRAGATGSIDDDTWRKRLMERFGNRWRMPKLRAHPDGSLTVDPTQIGTERRRGNATVARRIVKRRRPAGPQTASTPTAVGSRPGLAPAVNSRVGAELPRYRVVRADDVEPGMIAAYQRYDKALNGPAVLINGDHPVLNEVVRHWQDQYPDTHASAIREEIHAVYGELAAAKVAHSEHLKAMGTILASEIDDQFRSPQALTMALLGLIAEEAIIATRLGGKYRKRAST
jgi:hypothetical protein